MCRKEVANTAQRMKVSRKLRIWSHLLKKSLWKTFIFVPCKIHFFPCGQIPAVSNKPTRTTPENIYLFKVNNKDTGTGCDVVLASLLFTFEQVNIC